jgi:hypothetical protein
MTEQTAQGRAGPPRFVILGNDAVLRARPATPVQLAHACLAAGYTLAIPATWGDELIAAESVRLLAEERRRTMVMCSCPLVRQRLTARGPELASLLLSLVAPPVATARYLRAASENEVEVHYVGRCASGSDPSIDTQIDPSDFLRMLSARGIDSSRQPATFEGIIPPDRRRFWSLAGGFPTPDHLWESGGRRRRAEPDDSSDLATEVAEFLLSPEETLVDVAPSLGCCCAGVVSGAPYRTARAALALTEPPRATGPVVDHSLKVDLVQEVRIPGVTTGRSAQPAAARPVATPPIAQRRDDSGRSSGERRNTPGSLEVTQHRRRSSPAIAIRPSPTSVPVSRQSDGRLVPRAYALHRRPTPPHGSQQDQHAVLPENGCLDASDSVEDKSGCEGEDARAMSGLLEAHHVQR